MTAEGREGGLEPGGSTEALFCEAAGKLGNNLASKVFVMETQVKDCNTICIQDGISEREGCFQSSGMHLLFGFGVFACLQ